MQLPLFVCKVVKGCSGCGYETCAFECGDSFMPLLMQMRHTYSHNILSLSLSLSLTTFSPSLPPSLSPSLPPSLPHTVEHLTVSALQETFNVTGIHTLDHNAEIPPSQLRTIVVELYTTLRSLKPILGTSKLKQAQELCFNWLQMAYECSEGGRIDSGSLKITLCLFVGGKPADKSRCTCVRLIDKFAVSGFPVLELKLLIQWYPF